MIQRTAAARAARNLIDHLTSDLGGADQLSAGEKELVRRAALCGAIVADFEARWVAGQPVDLNEYLAGVNVQRRVLATLGLQRRNRDVTPDPLDYARERAPMTTRTCETQEILRGHDASGVVP